MPLVQVHSLVAIRRFVGPSRPGLATVIVIAGGGIIAFLVRCSWSCDALLLLEMIYLVQKDVA